MIVCKFKIILFRDKKYFFLNLNKYTMVDENLNYLGAGKMKQLAYILFSNIIY